MSRFVCVSGIYCVSIETLLLFCRYSVKLHECVSTLPATATPRGTFAKIVTNDFLHQKLFRYFWFWSVDAASIESLTNSIDIVSLRWNKKVPSVERSLSYGNSYSLIHTIESIVLVFASFDRRIICHRLVVLFVWRREEILFQENIFFVGDSCQLVDTLVRWLLNIFIDYFCAIPSLSGFRFKCYIVLFLGLSLPVSSVHWNTIKWYSVKANSWVNFMD